MTTRPYYSYLVCFHQDHTDIFLCGQPVGVIRDGSFHLHQIVTLSGNTRPVNLGDFTNLVNGKCPFNTVAELVEDVGKALEALKNLPEKLDKSSINP